MFSFKYPLFSFYHMNSYSYVCFYYTPAYSSVNIFCRNYYGNFQSLYTTRLHKFIRTSSCIFLIALNRAGIPYSIGILRTPSHLTARWCTFAKYSFVYPSNKTRFANFIRWLAVVKCCHASMTHFPRRYNKKTTVSRLYFAKQLLFPRYSFQHLIKKSHIYIYS